MEKQRAEENLIVRLTFEFASEVMDYCVLLEQKLKFEMMRQLFRSGTAVGAMVREAQNAESKADFIHKMKIAAKEGDETEYWLLLCRGKESYPDPNHLLEKLEIINKIIAKIISTTKKGS
jgi:four helix bundle protein